MLKSKKKKKKKKLVLMCLGMKINSGIQIILCDEGNAQYLY